MNKERRNALKNAMSHLEKAIEIISDVRDEEQDSMDNMPENLQGSERYETMEMAVESLEEAIDKIEEAKDSVDEAIDG